MTAVMRDAGNIRTFLNRRACDARAYVRVRMFMRAYVCVRVCVV